MTKYIALVAGKSGGHIVPGMTYVQSEHAANISTIFFSTNTDLDQTIVKQYNFIKHYIPLSLENFPGKKIKKYPRFIGQFASAYIQSIKYFYKYRPEKIISMGGYISIPVCFAAFTLRIPVTLFELNAAPGKAVKLLAPLAKNILICFKSAGSYLPKNKTVFTQYPVRFTSENKISKELACNNLAIPKTKKIILVLGGSQGSQFINKLITEFTQQYNKNIYIIHQAGSADKQNLQKFYEKNSVESQVFDYCHDLSNYYCAADIIIARAGAGTLFELIYFKKKALIIPLETKSTDHQLQNAREFEQIYPELITVITQKSIIVSKQKFFDCLKSCLHK